MAQLMYGKGYLTNSFGGTAAITWATVTGYITPLIPAPEIVEQEDEIKTLKDLLGIVEGIIVPNDCILKCTFNFIPRGSTKAIAAASAALPKKGPYAVANLPVVQAGEFADGFNCSSITTDYPWFYFGGGSLTGAEDGKDWRGTITMMRYRGIQNGTAIT